MDSLSLSGVPNVERRTLLGRLRHGWLRLFAGDAVPLASGRGVRVCEALLLVAAGLLFFWRIDVPLQEPEETLYAEVPRQMLVEERVLVPVRHGQAYYDKPPLLYWLVMGVYRVLGVHDWAARLVPSSALWLTVLVTYAWGKRMLGARAAFFGAVMLCLSPRFAQMGRMLTTNGLLTLWVTAALAAGHVAVAGPVLRWRWWLLSAAAAGLGVLTKGPVALVLVVAPAGLYLLLDQRAARVSAGAWASHGAIAGAIAVPWFVVVALRDPAFCDYFFWTHHVRRFLDPIDHLQPFWYYLPLLFVGTLPWSLLAPGLAWRLLRRPQMPRGSGFILLAGLWCLVFFSGAGCKRHSYILPALPPLALALGCHVHAAMNLGRGRRMAWACVAAGMFVGLWGTAEFKLPSYAARFSLRQHLLPQLDACDERTPVMCYPHGWDAVSYYLQRGDVQVFRKGRLDEMCAALEKHPRSLVVVKSDRSLRDFVAALPKSLQFVESSRDTTVSVGWVTAASSDVNVAFRSRERESFRGAKGDSSFRGAKGDSSFRGAKGDSSFRGAKGDSSFRGAKGDTSFRGAKGDSSFRGAKGDSSFRGAKGDSSFRGAKGDSSFRGAKGDRASSHGSAPGITLN